MPVSKEFVEEHIAGCPFTNFGKCKIYRCAFSVTVPPRLDPDERTCIIRAMYMRSLTADIAQQLAASSKEFHRASGIHVAASARFEESAVDSLLSLVHLAEHKQTDSTLRDRIQAFLSELRKAL